MVATQEEALVDVQPVSIVPLMPRIKMRLIATEQPALLKQPIN